MKRTLTGLLPTICLALALVIGGVMGACGSDTGETGPSSSSAGAGGAGCVHRSAA